MRNRDEIQVFSTAFLDLLFCGLAAVTLLWVLLEPSRIQEKPFRFAYIQVSQSGIWHLWKVEVTDLDDSTRPAIVYVSPWAIRNGAKPSPNTVLLPGEMQERLEPSGLLLKIEEGTASDGFAGRLTIGVDPNTKPCHIRVILDDCAQPVGFHPIDVLVESDRGTKTDVFLFTVEAKLRDALKHGSPTELHRYLAMPKVRSRKYNDLLELSFTARGGRVTYSRRKDAPSGYGQP